jgi:hypothetical protein
MQKAPKRLILKVYLLDQDKIRIFCHFINVLMAFWTGELKNERQLKHEQYNNRVNECS